jgi:hypothetical protein
MPRHSGSTDRTNRIVIEPAITRAFWSRPRAWNGADIRLTIETRNVPDATPVKVTVFEAAAGARAAGHVIDDLSAGRVIENNRCTIEYHLRWESDAMRDEVARAGGEREFRFRVRIERFELCHDSSPLYVDLGTLHYSS